jgi:tetratricopeptide (TPR) repeat protein
VFLFSLLGQSYFNVADYKTSAKWQLQCLQLAEKLQNVDDIVKSREDLGTCYFQLKNYKMAYKFLSTSIDLQISEGHHLNSSSQQSLKLLIWICDQNYNELEVPLAKYLKVELDLMKKHKHSPNQEYSETLVRLVRSKMSLYEIDDCCLEYINEVIGLLNKAEFNSLGLYEIAVELYSRCNNKFEEAIEILEHAKKDPNQAYLCLTRMGAIKAEHLKKFEEGLQNCHEALNLYPSKGGGQVEKCVIFMTIGDIYFGQKLYHDSLKYFEKAMEETNKTSKASRNQNFTELQMSRLWVNIAKTQCQLDMPKTALSSIKKSWTYLCEVDYKKHPKYWSDISLIKGHCYRKMGRYKKAIALTKTAIQQTVIAYRIKVQKYGDPGINLHFLSTSYTFLAGCAKLDNDKKCVDESHEKLIDLLCTSNFYKSSDELIQFINQSRNAGYPADDQELFMSKLKHVIDHSPLMLSDAPPDFVPKLSRYLNSWAISNLLKKNL